MNKKIAVIVANQHDFILFLRDMEVHDMRAAYEVFTPVMSVNDCMGRDFLGVVEGPGKLPNNWPEVKRIALLRVR